MRERNVACLWGDDLREVIGLVYICYLEKVKCCYILNCAVLSSKRNFFFNKITNTWLKPNIIFT